MRQRPPAPDPTAVRDTVIRRPARSLSDRMAVLPRNTRRLYHSRAACITPPQPFRFINAFCSSVLLCNLDMEGWQSRRSTQVISHASHPRYRVASLCTSTAAPAPDSVPQGESHTLTRLQARCSHPAATMDCRKSSNLSDNDMSCSPLRIPNGDAYMRQDLQGNHTSPGTRPPNGFSSCSRAVALALVEGCSAAWLAWPAWPIELPGQATVCGLPASPLSSTSHQCCASWGCFLASKG
jgi:hypothetical protein